ncbi:MAG: 2-hydroxyacid dehydrogenase [Phycisphaerae bacterium]
MHKSSVYITRMIPDSGIALLTGAGLAVRMNPNARPIRTEELIDEAPRHDALICQVTDSIDRSVLRAAAPRCKVVATCAVGFDNIDRATAHELGIIITNTPDVLTEATADLTWALLLATARRLGEAERLVRAGAWRGWGMMDFLGMDINGKTLGLIGAGRIGTAVAKRAAGFNMRLLYAAREPKTPIESCGATRVALPELLAESDFISPHVPLNEETHHLIDETAFDRMKRTAILINTARGPIVDPVALIEALRDGRIAAAGLDVYDKEPAIPAELLEMDNVVLLPHIGSATIHTRKQMANRAAANVIAVLRGEQPLNAVNP